MAKLENNTYDRNTDRLDHSIITVGITKAERKQTVQGRHIVIVLSRKHQALNYPGQSRPTSSSLLEKQFFMLQCESKFLASITSGH